MSESKTEQCHACIVYGEPDQETAEDIIAYLTDNKCKVCSAMSGPNGQPMNDIEHKLSTSDWIVILVSKETYRSSDWVSLYLAEMMSVSFDEGTLKVLPVLVNTGPCSLPDFIRWVTYIDIEQEPNYLSFICEAVRGKM